MHQSRHSHPNLTILFGKLAISGHQNSFAEICLSFFKLYESRHKECLLKHNMPIYLGFTNLNFVYFGQYRPLSMIVNRKTFNNFRMEFSILVHCEPLGTYISKAEKQKLELVPRLVDFFSHKNGDMILTPKICPKLRTRRLKYPNGILNFRSL